MSEFRITFGQQYRREPHPAFDNATPDGWLTVHASDEMAARTAVVAVIGRAWSGIYETPFDAAEWTEYYPLGEVGVLTTDGTSHELMSPKLTDDDLQRPSGWPGRSEPTEVVDLVAALRASVEAAKARREQQWSDQS